MKSDIPSTEIGVSQSRDQPDSERRRLPLGRTFLRLQSLLEVRDHELSMVLWASLFISGLLAGNYLIRPVRDEMGIAGGTDHLPVLFAGSFLLIFAISPLLSSRFGPRRIRLSMGPILRAYQISLIGFFLVFQWIPFWGQSWAARAFFILASVANLLVISLAWGSLIRQFTSDQAHRLFGLIAAGGTIGAIGGSAVASILAVRAGPAMLIVVAIGCLEISSIAARRVFPVWPASSSEARFEADLLNRAVQDQTAQKYYVIGLGLWTLLFTISSAFVYLEQARIVQSFISDPAARTSFFARIDLFVNVLGLALQVLLTGRVLTCLGAGGAAAILPMVTLLGALLLVIKPTVVTVLWVQVVRRAVDYAIARPSREVLYTAVDRAELLGRKGIIDTAVYRAGDTVGACAYGLLTGMSSFPASALIALVPLSLLWIFLSVELGRAMKRFHRTRKAPHHNDITLS